MIATLLCLGMLQIAPAPAPAVDHQIISQWQRTERRIAFEDAWVSAGEESRKRVRDEVLSSRRLAPSALHHVDGPGLVRWAQILRGQSVSKTQTSLGVWLANVSLHTSPGWVLQGSEESRSHVTVHVSAPALPTGLDPKSGELAFGLDWVRWEGPRQPSRSVEVAPALFVGRGFEIFSGLPSDEPGSWFLEPWIRQGEETIYGHRIPFLIAAKESAFGKVLSDSNPLSAWRSRGRRDLSLGPMGLLVPDTQPDWTRASWKGTPHAQLPAQEFDQDQKLVPVKPKVIVWLLTSGEEQVQAEFLGPRGRAWRDLAACGVQVVAIQTRVHDPKGQSIWQAMTELSGAWEGVPSVLVVRGGQVRDLWLGKQQAQQSNLRCLVLVAPRAPGETPRSPVEGKPTLFVLPSDAGLDDGLRSLPKGHRALPLADPYVAIDASLANQLGKSLEFLLTGDD